MSDSPRFCVGLTVPDINVVEDTPHRISLVSSRIFLFCDHEKFNNKMDEESEDFWEEIKEDIPEVIKDVLPKCGYESRISTYLQYHQRGRK